MVYPYIRWYGCIYVRHLVRHVTPLGSRPLRSSIDLRSCRFRMAQQGSCWTPPLTKSWWGILGILQTLFSRALKKSWLDCEESSPFMALRFRLVKYDNLPRIRGLQQLYRAGNECANVRMCCCQYPRQAEINSDDSSLLVGVPRFALSTWFCWDSTLPTKRRWWAEMTYRSLSPAVLIQYWCLYCSLSWCWELRFLAHAEALSRDSQKWRVVCDLSQDRLLIEVAEKYPDGRRQEVDKTDNLVNQKIIGTSTSALNTVSFDGGFCPTLGRHIQIHFIMVDFRSGLRNNLYDYYMTFQQIWE